MQSVFARLPLRCLAVLLLALSALAGPVATSAQAATANLRLLPDATIQARGVGVVVELAVRCSPGARGGMDIWVSQVSGDGSVLSGYRNFSLDHDTCDGTVKRLRRVLPAFDPNTGTVGSPWRAGRAFVTTVYNICDEFSCASDRVSRAVTVTSTVVNQATFNTPNMTMQLPAAVPVVADGAGATARVTYRCALGTSFSLGAELFQRLPGGTQIRSATASGGRACDGTTRTLVLGFHATGGPWSAANGLLILDVQQCGPDDCHARPGLFRTVRLTGPTPTV